MSFKQGDKVRTRQLRPMQIERWGSKEHIRDNESAYSLIIGDAHLIPSMQKFCGQILTITEVLEEGIYRVKENNYHWSSEMLEGYAAEYGDVMEFSCKKREWSRGVYISYSDHENITYPYTYVVNNNFVRAKYMRPIQKSTVDITVEGKTITISRESAKALGLVN